MQILLINLSRRPDRLAFMRAQFDQLGLPFERIDAIDGKVVDVGPGTDLISPVELACALSHRKAWAHFLDSGENFCLILEDDVLIVPQAKHLIDDPSHLPLDAEIVRLADEPITLAAAKAANWYELTNETIERYRRLGLNLNQKTRAALVPVLEQRRKNAAPILGQEMSAGSESQSFADMPEWCSDQSNALQEGYRKSSLLQEATGICESIVAAAWKAAGMEILDTRKQEIDALGDSAENLLRSNFYEVSIPQPGASRLSEPFRSAFTELKSAAASASASFESKRRSGIDAGLLEIETVFAEAGPLDPENKATLFCSQAVNNFDPRMQEFRNACVNALNALNESKQEAQNALNAAKLKAQCDEIWAVVPAPDGFREGRIRTPFDASAIEINALICNRDFQNSGMQIVEDSGFFSSEYLLVNEQVIGGTPVRFSAVLTKSATESGEWTLTDARLNDVELDGPTYKTSADFMRCGFFLEECFREN